MRILFCSEGFPTAADRLSTILPDVEVLKCPIHDVPIHLDEVDVLVPAMARIGAEILKLGSFGLIQQWGVGLEGVDLEAATKAGVWVARVPSRGTGNAESVAEHAVLMMLTLSRHISQARQSFEARRWGQPEGQALFGKTAVIVGLGDIGTALAVRLRALGMRLLAIRRRPELGAPAQLGIYQVRGRSDLHQILSEADFVIDSAKYDSSTHHLIDEAAIAALKRGVYFINVARGGLVDHEALLRALEHGRIAGAGLDVFWNEPVDPNHPLFRQNVLATPHIAGVTDVSYGGIAVAVAENLRRYAQRERPLYAVNDPPNPRW
jgi:phosphoglycerate dehydrogenase-like enzyme